MNNLTPWVSCRIWLCTVLQGVCARDTGASTALTRGAVFEVISGTVHKHDLALDLSQ
jgi:hypothetical protein